MADLVRIPPPPKVVKATKGKRATEKKKPGKG
jgi:hypothetical protein